MAALFQAGAQLRMIINLAVANEPNVAGAPAHRLMAGAGEIEN
jgi:hypothetical protein